jgi:hypothetical protein
MDSKSVLTYTPFDKATAIADVYEDQFRPNSEQQTFDNIYRQIRPEVNVHHETQPTAHYHHRHTNSNFANNYVSTKTEDLMP